MTILESGVAVIDNDTHHRVWIEQCGSLVHDPWMAEQICQHLDAGDVVVEGGAHIGTLTAPMLDKGAKVIAFEVNEEAVACLLHNCQSEHLTIHAGCALGETPDDKVTLHLDPNAGKSHVTSGGDIPCWTIDELALPKCHLIKLDVEGWEAKVLRGASKTIARCKPVLIIEINREALDRAGDSADGLLALIEGMGYEWKILQPDCSRGDLQYDVCAVPEK